MQQRDQQTHTLTAFQGGVEDSLIAFKWSPGDDDRVARLQVLFFFLAAQVDPRDVFLDAYRTFRDFDPTWLRLIEPLRSLRYIRYAGWIAQRWDDPAFPAAFPHFGTESYWEEETNDLEDQVEFIHKHRDDLPGHLQRPEVEEEETEGLTNKDYFFDLDH